MQGIYGRSLIKLAIFSIVLLLNACSLPKDRSSVEQISEDALEIIKNRDKIIVGVQTDAPPYGFQESGGTNAGLEIDLARYLAQEILGAETKVQFVPIYDATKKIELLQTQKIDLAIAGIKDNAPDLPEIDLSQPYYASGIGLLTRKDNQIAHWNELQGQSICAIRGNAINSLIPSVGIRLQLYRSLAEVYVALKDRRCSGLIYDDSQIASILQNPEWSQEWHQALPVILVTPWVIGLPKGEANLKKTIDEAIIKMAASEFIVRQEKKWQIQPTEFAREQMNLAKQQVDVDLTLGASKDQADIGTVPPSQQNVILMDGSNIILPIAEHIAQKYVELNPRIRIGLGNSGTTIGFQRFCDGNIDLVSASREITPSEIEHCETNKIEYLELPFAYDAIALVVNKENEWLDCLKISELANIWNQVTSGAIDNWQQISDRYPDMPLTLFGYEENSDNYNYLSETLGVNESIEASPNKRYRAIDTENIPLQEITSESGSLSFLNFAAYRDRQDLVNLVAIVNDKNRCTKPNPISIADGNYTPLSRPLYLYFNPQILPKNPELKEFMLYFLNSANKTDLLEFGYVSLSPEQKKAIRDRL